MTQNEILRKVTDVTARVLNLEAESIKPDSNFVFDLGAESTQSVELVASFEEEFGVELDEDAALAVGTVSSAAEFIGKYVNA
jgi:acyl carrier protein